MRSLLIASLCFAFSIQPIHAQGNSAGNRKNPANDQDELLFLAVVFIGAVVVVSATGCKAYKKASIAPDTDNVRCGFGPGWDATNSDGCGRPFNNNEQAGDDCPKCFMTIPGSPSTTGAIQMVIDPVEAWPPGDYSFTNYQCEIQFSHDGAAWSSFQIPTYRDDPFSIQYWRGIQVVVLKGKTFDEWEAENPEAESLGVISHEPESRMMFRYLESGWD